MIVTPQNKDQVDYLAALGEAAKDLLDFEFDDFYHRPILEAHFEGSAGHVSVKATWDFQGEDGEFVHIMFHGPGKTLGYRGCMECDPEDPEIISKWRAYIERAINMANGDEGDGHGALSRYY